ncbi:MAG: HNH endonuclease signature motif containing protein [Flavobacterium sp.]
MNLFNMLADVTSGRSTQWKKIRDKLVKEQPFCSACGSGKKLQVHHIEPFHVNPDKELDTSNMIVLCVNCHFVFGHLMDYSSWNIDVAADSTVYLDKVKKRPYKIKVQSYESNYWTVCCLLFIRVRNMFWRNDRSK